VRRFSPAETRAAFPAPVQDIDRKKEAIHPPAYAAF